MSNYSVTMLNTILTVIVVILTMGSAFLILEFLLSVFDNEIIALAIFIAISLSTVFIVVYSSTDLFKSGEALVVSKTEGGQ